MKKPTTKRTVAWRPGANPRAGIPHNTAAVIALMQMGISDHTVIAAAVGLDVGCVAQIDAAEDPGIRRLAVAGIPDGEYFKLRTPVRCPRCNGWIQSAPCVVCSQQRMLAT